MLSSSSTPLLFLRAVHRRLVIVRALERGGACAAVAAGFALLLVAAMWWEGRDGLAAGGITLAIGAIVGLAWGLARRPRIMDAAIEADRQLQLADLLGTALASLESNDPWHRAVVATAEARCRSLSPSSVLLHRLGARAWGGIGLSAALVLTLGVMSGLPRATVARSSSPDAIDSVARSDLEPEAPPAASRRDAVTDHAAQRTPRGADLESRDSSPLGTAAGVPSQSPENRSSPRDLAGGGAGEGRTDRADGALPQPTSSGQTGATGEAFAGGGSASRSPGAVGARSSTSGGSAGDNASSPPWKSPDWAEHRAAAGAAIRTGKVADSYREVVREYFAAQASEKTAD